MKLLVCTQAVDRDDPVLGFFHRWIEEFAAHSERVLVVCLREGVHALPKNVEVLSLGEGNRVARTLRFLRVILSRRRDYQAVFVHMNPEYLLIGGLPWRLMRKRTGLWYVHKHIDLKLRSAVLFADVVFTASKKSFRLRSRKLRIIGHGIDTELFSPPQKKLHSKALRIATVGRISPTKHLVGMLKVLDVLSTRKIPFQFVLVGAPATSSDHTYERALRNMLEKRPYHSEVGLFGPIPHQKLPEILSQADVFLNLSSTGSLDKAVLEAMAMGVPPVTSNDAFTEILPPQCIVKNLQPEALADALTKVQSVDGAALSNYVRVNHSLYSCIPKILKLLS